MDQVINKDWCIKCKAPKNSEKHQKHSTSESVYNRSERCRASKRKYKQSEKSKTRNLILLDANKCINHPNRDAITRGRCEDCWWANTALKNLGSKTLRTQLKEVIIKQEFRCVYSGVTLVPGINLQIDHLIPKKRGGASTLENTGGTTKEVNQLKGLLTFEEFLIICKLRWEERTEKSMDEASLLMISIWNYQLSKPPRPVLFSKLPWLP